MGNDVGDGPGSVGFSPARLDESTASLPYSLFGSFLSFLALAGIGLASFWLWLANVSTILDLPAVDHADRAIHSFTGCTSRNTNENVSILTLNSLLSLTRIWSRMFSPNLGRPKRATFCSSLRILVGRLVRLSGLPLVSTRIRIRCHVPIRKRQKYNSC